MEWLLRTYSGNWFEFSLLFGLLLILALVYRSGIRPANYHFRRILGLTTSEDAEVLMEENMSWQRIVMLLFSVLVLCLFYYFIFHDDFGAIFSYTEFWAGFGFFAGMLLIMTIVKIFFLGSMSNLFGMNRFFESYWNEFERVTMLFGVACYPLLVLGIYQPEWIDSSLNIVGIVLIFFFSVIFGIRLVFKVLIESGMTYFQIILYLCALEILPLLVVHRWLVDRGLLLA